MQPPAPVRPPPSRRKEKRLRRQQAVIRPPERLDFPERDAPTWKPLG